MTRIKNVREAKLIGPLEIRGRMAQAICNGEQIELSPSEASISSTYSVVTCFGLVVELMHNWLNELRERVGLSISQGTLLQYGRSLSYLCRWLDFSRPYPELCVNHNLRLLSRHDLNNWIRYMEAAGVAKKTLVAREACVKEFITWLSTIEGGNVRNSEDSPWGKDGMLRNIVVTPAPKSPKFIPTEMIIKLLLSMYNECERCMFHAQYDTGVRISELIKLTCDELPEESMYDPCHEFIPLCIGGVKGRAGSPKERITLISRAMLNRIKKYHSSVEYKLAPKWEIGDPKKPVFLTVNGLAWGARNASKQFKRAVRRVGLSDRFRSHWMRHGTAFSVLRSDMGKDYQDRLLIIQKMHGHARLSTTEIYTQIPPQMLAQLTKAGQEINRLEEAEQIRERTFLPASRHLEKRGHRGHQ